MSEDIGKGDEVKFQKPSFASWQVPESWVSILYNVSIYPVSIPTHMIRDEPWPEEGIISQSRMNSMIKADIQHLMSLSNHITDLSIGNNQHLPSLCSVATGKEITLKSTRSAKTEIIRLVMI